MARWILSLIIIFPILGYSWYLYSSRSPAEIPLLPVTAIQHVAAATTGLDDGPYAFFSKSEQQLELKWICNEQLIEKIQQVTEVIKPVCAYPRDIRVRQQYTLEPLHRYQAEKVAVISDIHGQYGECLIMQLDTVTLASQQLAACNRHSTVYMDVSPDGRYLVFNGSLKPDGSSLYQLDLHNPEAVPQSLPCTQHCQYRVRDLVFSPDGRYLAVTRRAHRLSEEIYLHNLATGEEQKLTRNEEDILGLAWHPDGRRLIYSALRHGRRQGFVVNLDEHSIHSLELEDFSWPTRITANGEVYYHTSTRAC